VQRFFQSFHLAEIKLMIIFLRVDFKQEKCNKNIFKNLQIIGSKNFINKKRAYKKLFFYFIRL